MIDQDMGEDRFVLAPANHQLGSVESCLESMADYSQMARFPYIPCARITSPRKTIYNRSLAIRPVR